MVFPIYWENFDKLVEKGTIISLISIKEEIESVVNRQEADDGILNWVEDHSQMFRFPPDERYAAEQYLLKINCKVGIVKMKIMRILILLFLLKHII